MDVVDSQKTRNLEILTVGMMFLGNPPGTSIVTLKYTANPGRLIIIKGHVLQMSKESYALLWEC